MAIANEKDLLSGTMTAFSSAGKVLVIAPHPDDEVFGCGGTLSLLRSSGEMVTTVIVSNGALGGDSADGKLIEIRAQESRAAARILGLDAPVFWGLPDRGINYGEILIGRLTEIIRETDAALVFLPAPSEWHPDHQAIAFAGAEAVRRLGGKRQAAFYEVSDSLPCPNLIHDISSVEEKKRQAMHCFQSQLQEQPYDTRISGLNSFRAFHLGAQAKSAEAFTLLTADDLDKGLSVLLDGPLISRCKLGFAATGGDMPLVSVIIRSMDRPTLKDALGSVVLQTYPNIEVVLVNAKGAEHPELEPRCGRFPLHRVGTGESLPRARAANMGLDAASGEYLAFLDDDDWFDANHVEKLVTAMKKTPQIKVVYSGVKSLDEKGNPLPEIFSSPFDAIRLLAENFIPIHAALFSRTLLELGCRFDESFDLYEDWDFWIQVSQFTDFQLIDGTSAVYRIDRQSGSGAHLETSRRESATLAIYRKWQNKLSDGQLIKIMQPIRQIPIKDNHISSLHQTVAERDAQVARLRQDVAERDAQVARLRQEVAERDAQVASFKLDMIRHQAQVAALSQAAGERDELLRSRSWRLTAPLRGLGTWVRRIGGAGTHCGLFSRLAMAICLLPATFFHYRNLREWAAAMRHGASFFGAVLNNPARSRARLAGMPRPVRVLVSTGIAVAQRIRNNGGVVPLARNMYRILAREGLRGVRVRMRMVAYAPERDVVVASAPANLHRILVADYRIPMPDVSAGERATVGILRDLCSLGYEVVFLPNDLASSPKYEAELLALGISVITSAQGYRSSVHYLSTQGHTFGVFYLIRVDVAETMLDTVKQVAPTARVIFHAPDLYFLRETREAELNGSEAGRIQAGLVRERELAIMRRVDDVVLVSPAEVPFLREHLQSVPISVFPALYAPVALHPAPFESRRNIFFLGGFAHSPNVDAVQWFAKEIWPLVHSRLPDVEFHIVGAEMPKSVLELANVPGIRVIGFVQDLDPLFASMRVGVAPLRYGAGIKGKVAMIMGAGVPCVCTGMAAEGMHLHDGVHTRLEDDPQAFANAVVEIYGGPELWARFSANGQELIRYHFGNEANRSSLLSVLDAARALPISLFSEYCMARPPGDVPVPPEQAEVDVSIIVPVYNQWPLTQACLNAILETSLCDDICLEIILADDGSSDETIHAAERYPGLKVVRMEKNAGFLRNCNNAARHARGRHILLLNNDTIVLPGWLPNLYRTLEQDPDTAIAGSKLLYPDGLIQEAGGVLFSDGTALNIGRGQVRDTPVFNIARETDYISGASILVRKSFWVRLGGFDERYRNAYCEDADLAMAARSLGMRVVYQPASTVVHYEHQTYADQAPTHNTGLQSHNISLMREKWQEIFQRDHLSPAPWQIAMANAERSTPAAARARRAQGRFNVLYFSPFPSHPASHGNRATINQFARRFQEMGHTVHFVLLQSNEYTESDLEEMRAAWDTLDVIPYHNPMVADGGPIPFDGWYEEGLGERIRCLCARYDIDVVFCSYVFQSRLLEFVPSYMLKVIDTHDKMGDRYKMLRANGQPLEFFSCTPEEEGAYLRRADVVVARREEEARYFDSVSGRATALVIPHVEDPHFVDKTFSGVHDVGMVASANRINLAIVRECLAAIESHLQGANCPFTVHVAGQVKEMAERLPAREGAVFRQPWVRMHGFVHDIGKFYADMDLILSPVTMGTGINVKTVQAMAHGMPLLTTECGSKGIETGDPMHLHANLWALAASLFALAEHPDDLQRLAALSRDRYIRFHDESVKAIEALFASPKLMGTGKP